jgi:hypothetical protein
MSPILIEDPNCEDNPFKTHEERDDTLFVLYHGTSSMFCDDIERIGFCYDNFKRKYGFAVCAVVDACNTLYFRPSGFATASLIAVNDKTVWFTPHFGLARSYASNTGSECIDGALRTAHEFLAFVRDSNRVKRQVEHWENVLKDRHHAETQQVLDNLRDRQLVEELADKVDKAQSFLKDKTSRGFPVVYAVLAGFSTLIKTTLAELRRRQREDGTGIADHANSDVILKEIVGRADFPNGITPGPFQKAH